MQQKPAISYQDASLHFFEEAPRPDNQLPHFFHAILIGESRHVTHTCFFKEIRCGPINHLIARKEYIQ